MKENNNRSNSMGFCNWLTLLFIALKLTGHISWSWFWVLSPIIIKLVIIIIWIIICRYYKEYNY